VTLHTRVSLLAVLGSFGGLALSVACSSDSAGPSPLPSCGAHGTQLSLAVGAYSSIDPASDSGCVTFAANAAADTAEYLVLPWSAGGTPQTSAPFQLQSATPVASIAMSRVASARPNTRSATPLAFDHFLRTLGRSRRYPTVHTSAPIGAAAVPRLSQAAAPPTVGSKRTFRVCADMSCDSLANVGAMAQSVGAHIAIYIDTLAPSPGLSAGDLDALRQTFDTVLYPLDTVTFGHVSDIDSNTVVIVLMSNQVNKLVTKAECDTSGYVAGFFFPGDLAPGFSTTYNNGEIFYSTVADPAGTLSCAHSVSEVNFVTPVTFTHEFQHMINFVEHVLVRGANDTEEGWLDEGLSKYAEEIAGRSFGDNAHFSQYAFGDAYDSYQYMLAPGDTPLLIPVDQGTLAMVGASWLFTRYIVDQFGNALPGKLVQTSLIGAANVAAQTGQPFDQTVSRWALANWVSDLPGFTAPSELQYTSWHFRATFASLHSQDSTVFPLAYPLVPTFSVGNAVNVSGKLWSGSGEYVRAVQAPGGAAFTLHFSANGTTLVSPSVVPRLIALRIR
jgi:hypothetical protein